MHITKVELENIKSHASSKFEFQRGTTAIIGENGAGKTTIIEAIAWVLFDFLDHKKSEFIKRGEKRGIVNVTFVSALDERRYVVKRDTNQTYHVFDPGLKVKIADKKAEVTRFLWQHLGVDAGTDLESLFRRAIGVPQGTFTAIFLESPAERKRAFDKLLKVEEYRESSDRLLETARYIEQKTNEIRENVARAEGELANFELLEKELETANSDSKRISKSIQALEKKARLQREATERYAKIEERILTLKADVESLRTEQSKIMIVLDQQQNTLRMSEEAASKIDKAKTDYERHIDALKKLHEFERERINRDAFRGELTKTEKAIDIINAEKKATDEKIADVQKGHILMEQLKPQIIRQDELEKEQEIFRKKKADVESAMTSIRALDSKIVTLRKAYETANTKSEALIKASGEAMHLAERQTAHEKLRAELVGLETQLAFDKQFQKDLKDGMCPVMSARCLNLDEGQTLDGFLEDKFLSARARLDELLKKQATAEKLLALSKHADKSRTELDATRMRLDDLAREGKNLNKEKDALIKISAGLELNSEGLAKIQAELVALENPKARMSLLRDSIREEIPLRGKTTQIESNLERLETDRRIKIEELEIYKDLDSNIAKFTAIRGQTADAYREYIANEELAKSLTQNTRILDATTKIALDLKTRLAKAEDIFASKSDGFDETKYKLAADELRNIERGLIEKKTNLAHNENSVLKLIKEIERLSNVRGLMAADIVQKSRFGKIGEITAFIRQTLKEAAPRVARNYIYYVSIAANRMFREITANASRTLKWDEDYGILLEEDGYDRPFQSLSGGEQMAAALSVRLALLKQLSGLRIAFFDEPTMNMDAERRELLAEQLSQFNDNQTFDQLFVISHDDTFEGFVDNVLIVE